MNIEVVSRWYQPSEIPDFEQFAQLGDIIEMKRPAYSHYAIYIGPITVNGKLGPAVIHRAIPQSLRDSGSISSPFTSLSSTTSQNGGGMMTKADVILELLADVIENCPFKINNGMDVDRKPLRQSEIMTRAQDTLLEGGAALGTYSVTSNNCEHFATWCRYGVKVSQQIEDAAEVATIGATLIAFVGVLGGAMALFGSMAKKERKRKEGEQEDRQKLG